MLLSAYRQKARLLALLAGMLLVPCLDAQAPRLFRISTENPPNHAQTEAVRRFAEELQERAGNRLEVRFSPGALLYRDADVLNAISRGMVEMAVPGIWQFDRLVPDASAFLLPSFYGLEADTVETLADGAIGAFVTASIENRLPVRVIGGYLALGHAHLFLTGGKSILIDNLDGLRIRVAGGAGNEERIAALGGRPILVPFPDLPRYLGSGLVDGVLTTCETVYSAGLDRQGLKTVMMDKEYYGFYIPIVNAALWDTLDAEMRDIIRDAWMSILPEYRIRMRVAQQDAERGLERRGLRILVPTASEVENTRRVLLREETPMAARLGMSKELLALVRKELRWERQE